MPLYERKLPLPDLAQYRPVADVAVQTDFYYERNGLPGVCIFVDGPAHDQPEESARDRLVRDALEDRGYRVRAIRFDAPLEAQIRSIMDALGMT